MRTKVANQNQDCNMQLLDRVFDEKLSKPEPFKRLILDPISNRVLLYELKSDKTDLFRKRAIVNAFLFAKKIIDETKGQYPSWYGPNPGGSAQFWFAENKETGLIHIQCDICKYCYHPGYVFERISNSQLNSNKY